MEWDAWTHLRPPGITGELRHVIRAAANASSNVEMAQVTVCVNEAAAYHDIFGGMSYVMPPNNNIAAICSQDRTDADRRGMFDVDLQLQLADFNNTPGGVGPLRGWGARGRGPLRC